MDFPVSSDKDLRIRLGLVFSAVCLLLFFKSRSLFMLFSRTAIGFATGFAIVEARRRTKSKRARYSLYGVIILISFLIIFIPLYASAQGCLAAFPYDAVNIFTGETKEFIYGGCGPRPHPWYYVKS